MWESVVLKCKGLLGLKNVRHGFVLSSFVAPHSDFSHSSFHNVPPYFTPSLPSLFHRSSFPLFLAHFPAASVSVSSGTAAKVA